MRIIRLLANISLVIRAARTSMIGGAEAGAGQMKAQTIGIEQSTGRILSSPIFRPGGKKLLAKGHILRAEDIRVLLLEGMQNIWVAEIEDGEVGEDEAVCAVAGEIAW